MAPRPIRAARERRRDRAGIAATVVSTLITTPHWEVR
jgi:hypothetical protein